jgi:tetratricopeptide (TPR) repeat protein
MQSSEKQLERKHNPYTTGISVGGSDSFVGRIDILNKVEQILLHQRQNAIVLFGQRRMGKTSILKELEKRLKTKQEYKPVFFDLLGKTYQPLQDTLQELAYLICDVLETDEKQLDSTDTFQQWLSNILEQYQDISLVLLLDEFDALEDDAQFRNAQESFFHYLRDKLLEISPRINFVFALGRNIGDLSNVAMSVFKGIQSAKVSLLTYDDTVQLIKFSEINASLKWSDESIEKVWELTNGHPFLTQALCSCIWENISSHEPITKLFHVEKNIAVALETGHTALEWLWGGLPPAEKIISSIIASQKIISTTELSTQLKNSNAGIVNIKDPVHSLKRWDLIDFDDKTKNLSFRVELIRQWVAENKPIDDVLEEIDHVDERADNFYKLAVSYRKSAKTDEDYEQAKGHLKQALELNPSHTGANQLHVDILIKQHLFDEARKKLETIYTYNPNLARNLLIYVLKELAKQTTNGVESIEYYEEILKLDPEDKNIEKELLDTLFQQAETSYQKEDYKQAETWIKKIFVKDRNNEKALAFLAKIYAGDSKIDMSEYPPEKVADLLFKKGEFELAIELYTKADKIDKVIEVRGHLCCQKLKEEFFRNLNLED